MSKKRSRKLQSHPDEKPSQHPPTTTKEQQQQTISSTTRKGHPTVDEQLGALEFAAALNGDDPRHILDCLKRFVKIVRQERRVALGQHHQHHHLEQNNDSGGDSSQSEEEEEDDDDEEDNDDKAPQTKKFKASESWKEDTRDYHVPFVGTAVAKGAGDRGTVVVGQWPTGLLKAYLERSPLAVELTGDTLIPSATTGGHIHKSLLRNKQNQLSRTLYKTYLKALAELVTAAISKETLKQELFVGVTAETNNVFTINSGNNNDPKNRFLIAILKDRLPGLLNLLQEETKRGKGPMGPLVPHALQVLSRVAMTSVENARTVVRSMEQSVSEGVWKVIIKLPPVHKHRTTTDNKEHNNLDKEPQLKSTAQRELGRTAFLALAHAMVLTKDATVFHYSSASGSKDRKVSAGILVLALRDACRVHWEESDTDSDSSSRIEYYKAISRFLQALRQALWDPARLLSIRRWVELFSADVLQNLCDISLHAPALAKPDLFISVLNANDTYSSKELAPLKQSGVEARRLLWSLLVDSARSPLLQMLLHDNSSTENKNNHTEHAVIRAMCRLLDTPPSSGRLGIQACLCHGIQTNPTLLPGLFQKLSVPDSNKKCFSFLALLRFISQLLREGPLPSASLPKTTTLLSCVAENDTDTILRLVLPSALKKNVFSKAIQSRNALLVSETMKVLVCIFQRLDAVKKEIGQCMSVHVDEFWDALSAKLMGFLPDIQVVLATLSRFDVLGEDPAAVVVHGHLAQLLLSYGKVLPNVLKEVKFDWVKLLPSTFEGFNALPKFLQLRLLRTLETILKLSEGTFLPPASCRILLEIMTKCEYTIIHKVAKRICCFALQLVVPAKGAESESRQCLMYEISCWSDCITSEDVPEYCSVLQQASELSFQSDISYLRAWNSAGLPIPMPTLPVSPILMAALSSMQSESYSVSFTLLVNQVATKCLLYHANPLPMASLITHFYKPDEHDGAATTRGNNNNIDQSTALLDYADSLTRYEQFTGHERERRLTVLVAKNFSERSFHHKVLALMLGRANNTSTGGLVRNSAHEDVAAIIRQLLHLLASLESDNLRQNCVPLLRQLLPIALESCDDGTGLLLEHLYSRLEWCRSSDLKYIDMCVLSRGIDSAPQALAHRVHQIIESTSSVSQAALLSEENREQALSLFSSRGFLSARLLDRAGRGYLRLCCQTSIGTSEYTIIVALATGYIRELLSRTQYESSKADDVFDTWVSLTDKLERSGSASAMSLELVESLERLICVYISKASVASAQIFATSLQFNPAEILKRIFATRAMANSNITDNVCMLVRFLEADSCRFMAPLVKCLAGIKENKELQNLWLAGSIDDAVLRVLSLGDWPSDLEEAGQTLVSCVMDRSLLIFSKMRASNDFDGNSQILKMLNCLTKEILATTEERIALASEVAQLLKSSQFMKNGFRRMDTSTQQALFNVALVLRDVMDETDSVQAQAKGVLSTTLFVRLCEVLPRSLKKYTKALEVSRPVEDVLEPVLIIDWVCSIVGEFPSFDMDCLVAIDPKCMSASLRACLKYGMIDMQGIEAFSVIAPDCLRLARELVLGIAPGTSSTGVTAGEFPQPAEVYEMVVSHSNFYPSLTATNDGEGGPRKLELLRLLLSCISLSSTTIVFEKVIWEALFEAYYASVGAADSCMRRILYLSVQKHEKVASLPYMDQFRWNGISLDGSKSSNQYLWEWLLNGLELGRVRHTLRNYPINDRLVPDPVSEVELWALMESSPANSDEMMDIEDSSHSSALRIDQELCRTAQWKAGSADRRYSPGYVLPLILAALENCVEDPGTDPIKPPQNHKSGNNSFAGATDPDPKLETLARVAKRLSDKGALALAFAALCSKCPSLRQVAVSVLGFFMRAMETKEAHDLSSWRERPQLVMLLRSVHRSLAIRRSVLLAETQDGDGSADRSESHAWEVPMFPGFSAIFLARTSLILARPGDSMYAPLNRFFLSIDKDHGGFRDMNRLPAFISMLCSASDEPTGQARAERLWALGLFRDGFHDPSCFKMASACHAPELLLTTFYNFRMRSLEDTSFNNNNNQEQEECLLFLEALTTMVQRGGRQAAHHLISRLGLLSWLRSVLVSDALLQIVPTKTCRVALLELIAASMLQASKYEATDSTNDDISSLTEETLALAQPTLQLCLDAIERAQRDPDKNTQTTKVEGSGNSETLTPLLVACHRALNALRISCHLIHRQRKEDHHLLGSIRNDGIHVPSALRYLELASLCPLLQRMEVLAALNILPMSSHTDPNDAIEFSQLVLKVLATAQDDSLSKDWVEFALKRTYSILNLFWRSASSNCDSSRDTVLQTLFDCRSKCSQWTQTRVLWFQCLQELVSENGNEPEKSGDEDDEDSTLTALAREIVQHYSNNTVETQRQISS